MKKAIVFLIISSITSQIYCMNTSNKEFKQIKKEMKTGFKSMPTDSKTNILCGGLSVGVNIASKPIAKKLTEKIMGEKEFQKAKTQDKEHPIKSGFIDAIASITSTVLIGIISKSFFS